MNENQITKKVEGIHGGSFTSVVYKTVIATNKDHKNTTVYKIVKAVVRLNVRYSSMASVKQKLAQKAALGLAADVDKLPWGTWKGNCLIENKGQLYVRFAVSKNNASHKSKVLGYYADGKEISEAEARELTRPSEWDRPERDLDVYTKKIEDILVLGK